MRSITGIGNRRPAERASMTANGLSQGPRAQRTNPSAIAALVCSILMFCLPPAGIAAIILGHRALRQIRRSGEDGYGLARAGLIVAYLGLLVMTALPVLIALAPSQAAPGTP